MYIKKKTLILLAVLLMVATSVTTIGIVNPFGFTHFLSFLKFNILTDAIEDRYYTDVPVEDYVNSAISGFAEGTGDPYTDFIYGEEADAYMEDISGSFDGIGSPEPLKGDLSGFWSRRIDQTNRLVYRVSGGVLEILSCRGHYDD